MIPGSFGIHEDVHVDLNARITVDATEGHSVALCLHGSRRVWFHRWRRSIIPILGPSRNS